MLELLKQYNDIKVYHHSLMSLGYRSIYIKRNMKYEY